ncbi:glutamate-gated chloride channel-like [Oppia nitens]|uniref:glutamate-gated chloride channel-like n=1 Tax=Oppia nitens TaxID=1686743 RepID=UPI0023DA6C13|nr:glutamate-gated chloride channel-like [Oppia nitens]
MNLIQTSLVVLSLCLTLVLSQVKEYYEQKTVEKLLANYDRRFNPWEYNWSANGTVHLGPINVTVNMYVRSIEYIDSKRMQWKVQLTYRQKWQDMRLQYDDRQGIIRYVQLANPLDTIWVPDMFISNARETYKHVDILPNQLVRIYPDGWVLFSIRLTTTMSCPMNLVNYPFDRQVCSIQLASYGYTTDSLVYMWKEDDPVQITKNVYLPQFTLNKYLTSYCTSRTNTGEYSCLKVDLQFTRAPLPYIWQWFVPMTWLTFLGFISFFVRPANSGRLQLLLAILAIQYVHSTLSTKWSDSKVSYTTLRDLYFGVSYVFTFGALVEYALVWLMDSRHRRQRNRTNQDYSINNNNNNKRYTNTTGAGDSPDLNVMKPILKYNSLNNEGLNRQSMGSTGTTTTYWCFNNKLDLASAILFPILYLGFIIYFICKVTLILDIESI